MSVELSTSLKAEENYQRKETKRGQWNSEFEKSHTHIARYIAKKIEIDVLIKANDPYLESPTKDARRYHFVPFNVESIKDLKSIVDLFGKCTALKPMGEWAERFRKEAEKISELKENSSLKSNLDAKYFQPKITQIAKLAMDHLREQLEEYAKKENTFKFKIKWFDSDESSIMNLFTDVSKNYLGIATWFEEPVAVTAITTITPISKTSVWNKIQEYLS